MLALFVSPCKTPEPKLRGKFFVKEVCQKERMEHPIGIEPITRCLQGSRSTIELREQIAGIIPALLYGLRPLYIIHYVSRNFVPNLSQVLQLCHTVSANSVSL